jgi:DNA-binding transcriptional LysR family regulator
MHDDETVSLRSQPDRERVTVCPRVSLSTESCWHHAFNAFPERVSKREGNRARVYGEAAPFVCFLSASRRARATPPPLPRLPLPTSGNGAGRLTTVSEMWGWPTIWPTFEYHRHPQPKIASQSDFMLSTGLAGTPVIAVMLSGLVPHDLVLLRCYLRS